jgi:integrase
MIKTNAKNERIKHAYFIYLREARRRNEGSVDAVAKAISRFEESTDFADFGSFHRDQAVTFKRKLDKQTAVRGGARLSRATVHSTLSALRNFFIWLRDQPGYKRRLNYSDADYFNLSEKDVRIAQARRLKAYPTLEQVHALLARMPATNDIEKRDRALVAFTILTAARDGALASLKLRHVNLAEGRLDQDAREVKTKFSKTINTWFYPVGGDARAIVTDWIEHLRANLLWSEGDPLFPKTRVKLGRGGGEVERSLERAHWSTAGPIRRIFREAFVAAGQPYFSPHAFRHTVAVLGERTCINAEEQKAWSMNMGHEKVATTLTSYAAMDPHRQAELIQSIGRRADAGPRDEVAERLARIEAALVDRDRSTGSERGTARDEAA